MVDIFKFLFCLMAEYDMGGDFTEIEDFLRRASGIMLYVALAGLIFFVILNPGFRKRKNIENKVMLGECLLLFAALIIEILYRNQYSIFGRYFVTVYVLAPPIIDMLYMMAVLQWLIFVDYSLYHSVDHIKRRYKFSAVPVFVIVIVNIFQNLYIYTSGEENEIMRRLFFVTQYIKTAIELFYILVAVYLSASYGKEHNEPGFLRLKAFIIPFVLGCLVRRFDVSLMVIGVVLTCETVKKRYKYIDRETGFYNRAFLDVVSSYRDANNYVGGNGILIKAEDKGKDMADLLNELRPSDSNVFLLDRDCFLILGESFRDSAVKMTVMTITEAAETSEAGYTPQIETVRREKNETAKDFANRILSSRLFKDAA